MQQGSWIHIWHLPIKKNDGYLNFNDISVYKVYIDFLIKILEAFSE